MSEQKACKKCRLIINGTQCPICGSKDLSTKWDSYIIIINSEKSKIAEKLELKFNSMFAINIKD
ncbi:MAG: DNA-directed RNA polymerase subunit E'' [Candidatus Marsarchaeota archaeon]|jgi:DNA-directed RNA polymerase, subunit E''''|nr:DNA-directed RNA polymerase subunit E'' [Candidatus Marsarchaeota archaeon]MCL5094511.1 DNA-directed RNA polymerase subunit E'' [Candidatus Marsarchaeota archaeon]